MKSKPFYQKDVQCHKWNYDQCSRTVSLKLEDTVLEHVSTFEGQEKIQNRQDNTDYVVEWQHYPDLPIYVVHPIDRKGCSYIQHRNNLLPINNNFENRESVKSVGRTEPIDSSALEPHTGDVLLVDHLAWNWLDSTLNLLSSLDELVILEITGLTATAMNPLVRVSYTSSKVSKRPPNSDDLTDEGPTDDIYAPALRHCSRSTKHQLLKRYQHFTQQQSTIPSGTFDICICLYICLHVIL